MLQLAGHGTDIFRVLKLQLDIMIEEEGNRVNIEFEYFEKRDSSALCALLFVCLCHFYVLIHFTSAYHKTLEC